MRKIKLAKRPISLVIIFLLVVSALSFPLSSFTADAAITYEQISYNATTGRGTPTNQPQVNGHAVQRTAITGHEYVDAIFGTQGYNTSWNNVDYRAAFDGNNSGSSGTFFDGYVGGHVGVEFKQPQIVSQIAYRTRQNAARLNGASFQGSNDGINYTTLYRIECPATNTNYTRNVENSSLIAQTPYKYYRIFGDNTGDMLNVCELYLYTYAEGTGPFDALSIPETVGDGYELPTTIIGSAITWSADLPEMLNGNVIKAKAVNTPLVLTATIGEESRQFPVTVTGLLNALDIPTTVTNGYELPTLDGAITWSSSIPAMLNGSIIKAAAFDTPILLSAAMSGSTLSFPVTVTGILDGIVVANPFVTGRMLPEQSFGEDITWECDPPAVLVDGALRTTVETEVTLTAKYGTDVRVFPDILVVLVPPVVLTGNEWSITGSSTGFNFSTGGENPRSNYYLYDTEQKALENFTLYPFADEAGTISNSESILPLNGTWKFHFSRNPGLRPWPVAGVGQEPRDFISNTFDDSGWDDMTVPKSWQVTFNADGTAKYDQAQYVNSQNAWNRYASNNATTAPAAPTNYNGVGTYRRTFEIPADWEGKQIFLNFDGISACYIWINGRTVGWSTDIWTHHEFDITPYLKAGENVIALQLIRWTSGSWLENQDMLRLSGIARNTYLMARNPEDIWDFQVSTTPVSAEALNSGQETAWTLGLKTAVRDFSNPNKTSGQSKTVHYKLYDAQGNIVKQESKTAEYEYVNFSKDPVSGSANVTTETLPFGGGVRYTATPEITDSTNISLAIPEFTAELEDPHLWSAEDPYLYKLVMYVDNGEETEYTAVRIGFRYTTYVNATNAQTVTNGVFAASSGSYWLVNGKRVALYGANIHETNPDTGYAMTLDLIREDEEQMKRHNVNAIRMAHYPHDTRYYDIADELGIYVMDEANHESHNSTGNSTAGYFMHTLRDRMLNMYERDKNMTSVISWSAGNESAMNASSAGYSIWVLKARENEQNGLLGSGGRPTHAQYSQTYADMWSGMYPSYGSISQPNENKVKINCEYSHAMGNAMGNMDTYVKIFDGTSYVAGGFIWDWVDQSIKTPVPPSDTVTGVRGDSAGEGLFYGYDSDWGNTSGDLDFAANGVLLANRQPKPHATEVKRQYQRLKTSGSGAPTASSVSYNVKNYFMHTNASAYDMTWQLLENGTVIRQGEDVLDIAPAPYAIANDKFTAQTFTQEFETVMKKAGAEYFFNIQFRLREATDWAEEGYVIAENQVPLTTGDFAPTAKPVIPMTVDEMTMDATGSDTDGTIEVTGPDNLFSYKFDKVTGAFTDMSFKGRQFATLGYEPNFYMPRTDNQYGESTTNFVPWKNTGANRTQTSTTVSVATTYANYIEIVTTASTAPNAQSVNITTTYKIYPTGEVNVSERYVFGGSATELNVVGGYLKLVPGMENMTYFARGPVENYVDRKAGTDVGLFSTTVTDNYTEYIASQDTGARLDTRWAAVTDDTGFGVVMKAGEFAANNLHTGTGSNLNPDERAYNMSNLVEFNALHYGSTQFGDARQKHPYQVYDEFGRNNDSLPTYMYVNVASRGRGGDTSWGNQATPKAPYRLNVAGKTATYNFSIIPVDNFDADSSMDFAQTKRDAYQNVQDLLLTAWAVGVPVYHPAYIAASELTSTANELDAVNVYNELYAAVKTLNVKVTGNTAKASIQLDSAPPEGVQLILAFYDSAGMLLSTHISSGEAQYDELDRMYIETNVPGGTMTIKGFYWDANFVPICPAALGFLEER
ncbi:MAG TPA: hypothetical protein DEQ02_10230 [Ruminococcaceae bacterium]|nr:hypothetical protein [Oscillospiraceae bacterium]